MQPGGIRREFYTLKSVEGELLADRLKRGPLSAAELFCYAIAVGRHLQDAHTRREVHGRISPFAVLLTASGARLLEADGCPEPEAAAYRSPEQVRGEPPDERSDIFAYGALLYEMASGRKAFAGDSGSPDRDILQLSPAPLEATPAIREALSPLIYGCLEKEPSARRQRMQNAVLELRLRRTLVSEPAVLPPSPARPGASIAHDPRPIPPRPVVPTAAMPELPPILTAPPSQRSFGFLPAAVCAGLLIGLGIALAFFLRRSPAVQKAPNPAAAPDWMSYGGAPAISPEGAEVAFPAQGPDGRRVIWLRRLDGSRSTPLAGTEGASEPFWSPDGQFIGFFADGSLKKIRVAGGAPELICTASRVPGGGTWSPDGTILFAPTRDGGLFRVNASGGSPEQLLAPDTAKPDVALLWPQFLPGGKRFIFFGLTEDPATTGIYAGSAGSAGRRFLIAAQTSGVYAPATEFRGYVLFLRGKDLVGQPIDSVTLNLAGSSSVVAGDIDAVWSLSLAPVSVSENGTLAVQTLGRPTRRLLWVDRAGGPAAAVRETGLWAQPNVAPDGRHAIVAKLDPAGHSSAIWLVDASGAAAPVSNVPAGEGSPVWSPDGKRIAASAIDVPGSDCDLYIRPADGRGIPQLLLRDARPKYPTDWSRDGAYVLFTVAGEGTGSDVWAYSTEQRRAGPIIATAAAESQAVFSPDSRWLAYQSDESGSPAVYVQPFEGLSPGSPKRWRIGNGVLPRWSRNGTELLYTTAAGRIMAVPVHSTKSDFSFDLPHPLFDIRPAPETWNPYDVSPDGERLLINLPLEWSASSAISVIRDWTRQLKP